VGVAVKMTVALEQVFVPTLDVMPTEGVRLAVTVTAKPAEVVAEPPQAEVTSQV
jgi:hypothetical protein